MAEQDPYSSCAICRFMRALAFSAIGAAVAGYGALWMGMGQDAVMLVAFFGALAAVVWANRKRRE